MEQKKMKRIFQAPTDILGNVTRQVTSQVKSATEPPIPKPPSPPKVETTTPKAPSYATPTAINRMDTQVTTPKPPAPPKAETLTPKPPASTYLTGGATATDTPYAPGLQAQRQTGVKEIEQPHILPQAATIQQEKRWVAEELGKEAAPVTVSEPEIETPRRPRARAITPTRRFTYRHNVGEGEDIAYVTQQLEHWAQVLAADQELLTQYQNKLATEPSQEHRDALGNYLEKVRQDAIVWNGYMGRYQDYYSPEAFQSRINALEAELAQKQQETSPTQYWDPGRISYSQRQSLDSAAADVKELEAKIAEEKSGKRFVEYEALRTAPDFEEKSAYKPNRGKPVGKLQYMSGYDPESQIDLGLQMMDTGYEDITYDSINGDHNARLIASQFEGANYEEVPEDVVKMFNYIYEEEGRDAAYEYMDFMAQRQYSTLYTLSIGMADAMGVTSASKAIAKGLAVLAGEPEAADEFGAMADQFKAQIKHQHPISYMVGGGVGTFALMKGIAKGLYAIPGFSELSAAAKAVLAGAGTMGGASAVQEAGDMLIGSKSWQEFVTDVLMNTTAGGLGGGVSQKLSDAGLKLLEAKGWEGNTLARVAVAGISGSGYALTSTAVQEAYRYGKDPENYELDAEQIALNVAVGFAFAAINSYANARRVTGSTAETDADDALMEKYFKGMSREEARTAYHRLAKEYADVFHKTGELATYTPEELARFQIVQEINAAWKRYNVVNGAKAYKQATTAQANGDVASYQQAASDFASSVKDLQTIVGAGTVPTSAVTEAMEILQSVSADMSNAAVSPKAEAVSTPSSVSHVLALAQQANAMAEAECKIPDWVPQSIRDGMKEITALNMAAAKRNALGDLLGYPRDFQKSISLFLDKVLADAEDIARWESMELSPDLQAFIQPQLEEKKNYLQWLEDYLAKMEEGERATQELPQPNGEVLEIRQKKLYNEQTDREQFDSYQTILPADEFPSSFEEFQDIKYTDRERYVAIEEKVKLYRTAERTGTIPDSDAVITPPDKFERYLLDPNHSRGKNKAYVIERVLGYNLSNWKEFVAKLRAEIQKSPVKEVISTEHGVRYIVPVIMWGKKGRFLYLDTVWQIDRALNVPRFITATFPERKEK